MKIHYKLSGTPNSPALILSNSLGCTSDMWNRVIPFLVPYFRVIQYDNLGHGLSDKPDFPYTIAMHGETVLQIMDELKIEKAFFCGVSMGGLTGQWLALHAPDKFEKLCFSNTAAKIGESDNWKERIELLQKNGMKALVESTMDKWFTPGFQKAMPERFQYFVEMFKENNINGYCNCCHAIGEADFRQEVITSDVLIIAGSEDPVTTVEHAEALHQHIPGSSLAVLPGRHLLCEEHPEMFTDALIDFFVGPSSRDRGMHVRGTVLGNDYLNLVKSEQSSFTQDFQELIAQVPWGKIWTRPGLTKQQRSLITLSAMIALNREEELKLHIRAAFNNGVTEDELKELILQSAIYCGFPAANSAFRIASEIIQEINTKK